MEFITAYLPYAQIILSALIIASVLLQRSGSELGGALGGGTEGGAMYHKKRGAEKFFYQFTIVLGILFAASAILSILV